MFRDVMVQNCIQACIDCELECERCSTACLIDRNAAEMAHCIQLMRDASNIAALAVKYLAHNSDFAQKICETCVDVCLACRDECARHEDAALQACADACHRCAEECEKMALQPVP